MPAEATGARESDDVFVVHIDHIGLIDKEDLRLTLEEDRITFEGPWLSHDGQLEPA